MKKLFLALIAALLLIPALCLAEDGPVLLVELPDGAQTVEDLRFDDGDFIQTYQLADGARVQLLRYGAFDMTLADLMDGEWAGHGEASAVLPEQLAGLNAEGARFVWAQDGQSVDVTIVLVRAGGQTLIFQAVYPLELGQEAVDAAVSALLGSLNLLDGAPPEEAVVG